MRKRTVRVIQIIIPKTKNQKRLKRMGKKIVTRREPGVWMTIILRLAQGTSGNVEGSVLSLLNMLLQTIFWTRKQMV